MFIVSADSQLPKKCPERGGCFVFVSLWGVYCIIDVCVVVYVNMLCMVAILYYVHVGSTMSIFGKDHYIKFCIPTFYGKKMLKVNIMDQFKSR